MKVMEKEINQFDTVTGSDKLGSQSHIVPLAATGISIYVIWQMDIGGALAPIAIPFILLYFYWLFKSPVTGLLKSQ